METKLIKLNSNDPDIAKIQIAAKIIRDGGIVAFPTETVYGLGADGMNEKAVQKIFIAKGRPQDNPLILHVSDIMQVELLVDKISKTAKILIDKFWPGPLTLVMKRSKLVPDCVTAGLDSVAVRMPKNKIALELIKASGCQIAAPSANLSGKPSTTSAKHVLEDMDGRIDAVIDGGEVEIGLESTVVDLTHDTPQILRPGKITKEQMEKVIGEFKENKLECKRPRAPGMKYTHYSPQAKVIIIKNQDEFKKFNENNPDQRMKYLSYENEIQMAKNLFNDFRQADEDGYQLIFVKEVKDESLGTAIMDRLKKASGS